jgi:zinc/manganese transport system ATP-binding protein
MMAPAIRLQGVSLRHGGQLAVEALSGAFAPGSLTAIVGPNGAGKTTLLRALAGLHPVDAGRIDRGGLARDRVGFVAQAPTLDRSFPVGCLDVVALARTSEAGWLRAIPAAGWDAARAALAAVGLAGLEARPVGSLSAGQSQRLMFARAIAQDAPLLLLDEPFNAVDEPTAAALLAIVHRWHGEGRTVVVVVHDLDLVRREFPAALVLNRRAVAWGRTAEAVAPENLRQARLGTEGWAEPATALREPA